MCVIIASEKGAEIPTKKGLKYNWNKNPDGGGFASWNEETKEFDVEKGFTSFKKFWKAFNEHKFQESDYVIIHFRIGTSGKIGTPKEYNHPDCTHPFPISSKYEELSAITFSSKTLVVHNGVWGKGSGDFSDTMVAIRDYITPLIEYIDKGEDRFHLILENVLSSSFNRWIIASKTFAKMYGKWHTDPETKIMYSKSDYKKVSYVAPCNTVPMVSTTTGIDGVVIRYASLDSFWSKDKGWDWVEWNKYNDSLNVVKAQAQPINNGSLQYNGQDATTIYDKDGSVLAIVAKDGGAILWEKETNNWVDDDEMYDPVAERMEEVTNLIYIHGEDYTFNCVYCGNPIKLGDITPAGECPHCYGLVIPSADIPDIHCPHCGETRSLIDHTLFDIECCRCGALFDEKDTIVTSWNTETKKQYEAADKIINAQVVL